MSWGVFGGLEVGWGVFEGCERGWGVVGGRGGLGCFGGWR